MIWTAKTWEHVRKVFTQCNCENRITVASLHNTRIVLQVPSTIARAEICLGCWRDRPFLKCTHLVFNEVVWWEGRKQHDQTPMKIASALEFPCYSHYAECLAKLKQVPIFKVLDDPTEIQTMPNCDLPGVKWAL